MTVEIPIGQRPVRRSYTIASSPARSAYCEITVRHEPGGVVSGYLHDTVREGSVLQVIAPSGKFTFDGHGADSIVLIAGGVGVTPMMGVVRYLTDRSWPGDIYLLYASRSVDDIVFREEIEYLSRRYPNLHTTLVVERGAPESAPYPVGRITRDLLQAAVPEIEKRHVHLCGPKPMMAAMRAVLGELGVPVAQIESEVFVGSEKPLVHSGMSMSAVTTVTATFARSGRSAPLPAGKTILEAAEDVGVNIEFSCRSGVCGACKTKLLSGVVMMAVEDALDPADRKQNIILACQATASADVSVDA